MMSPSCQRRLHDVTLAATMLPERAPSAGATPIAPSAVSSKLLARRRSSIDVASYSCRGGLPNQSCTVAIS